MILFRSRVLPVTQRHWLITCLLPTQAELDEQHFHAQQPQEQQMFWVVFPASAHTAA